MKSDRVVKKVPAPPLRPIDHDQLFLSKHHLDGKPNWRLLKDHLKQEGRVNKADCLQLIQMASTLFRREPNLIELQDPVTIVGDIHGQYYDMLKLLDLGGNPERTKYVFLGDYVDRVAFSLEVLLVLYALKVNFPNTLFLLRGNHECRQLTTFFSFRKECLYKHDLELYDRCMESFDCMPLACVVDGKFLTVHGGLGPEMVTLADINAISRFQEPPKQGSFCDILWADPYETDSRSAGFRTNDVRGCSYFFTKEAVVPFLKRNDLLSVIRAHEAQLDGFKMYNWNGDEDFPAVITVFSAPNYCDVYNNKGAIIKFENSTLNIQQFNYTQHPYCLPDFMDVFAWSLPFVLDRVSEILLYVMVPGSGSDGELTRDLQSDLRQQRREAISDAVRSIVQLMKKHQGSEASLVSRIKQAVSADRLPSGVLQAKPLDSTEDFFVRARSYDIVNEKRPE